MKPQAAAGAVRALPRATNENAMSRPAAPAPHPYRRAVAVFVALILGSLAFGVGLPWIIVDAPPQGETLWAREVQSHTVSVSTTAPKLRSMPGRALR